MTIFQIFEHLENNLSFFVQWLCIKVHSLTCHKKTNQYKYTVSVLFCQFFTLFMCMENKTKRVLAIETSCDDTSLAIVSDDGVMITCEHIAQFSQVVHNEYGGVVPELASREHANKILLVLQDLKKQSWQSERSAFFSQFDAIAVTVEPGLPGSLVVWKTLSRLISHEFDLPMIPVNHIYGHIFSLWLERTREEVLLPCLLLSVSGGHNHLYLVDKKKHENEKILSYDTLWEYHIHLLWKSRDDAVGECFDKVARVMWWPYPGGKWIDDTAAAYDPEKDWRIAPFTRTFLSKETFEYSFSWLKSQVQRFCQQKREEWELNEAMTRAIAAEFQEAVVEMLMRPISKALEAFPWIQSIGLVWWVSASSRLRSYVQKKSYLSVLHPKKFVYCTDNGAMIWAAGLLWS